MAICQQILVPLSRPDTVFLEKSYANFLLGLGAASAGVEVTELGMGSSAWYPRCASEGDGVLSLGEDEDDESDGATTAIEA